MSDRARRPEERRLRRAAVASTTRQAPEPATAEEEPDDDSATAQRLEQKSLWVDLQIRRAIERGDFDHLPGAGKPIRGIDGNHDPNWWVKNLIEREQITGVLPPALALRKAAFELDTRLDREATEEGVRQVLADFNHQVVEARRQLLGGPPVVTPTREPDQEVARWRARREESLARLRAQRAHQDRGEPHPRRIRRVPRWWPLRERGQ